MWAVSLTNLQKIVIVYLALGGKSQAVAVTPDLCSCSPHYRLSPSSGGSRQRWETVSSPGCARLPGTSPHLPRHYLCKDPLSLLALVDSLMGHTLRTPCDHPSCCSVMATKISFSIPRADTRISSSCGGKAGALHLWTCEIRSYRYILPMYQLQFKAGSDLDEKLSKKTKVIK